MSLGGGRTFPGAETSWVSVGPVAGATQSKVQEVEQQATAESNNIAYMVTRLRAQAEAYAERGYKAIDDCLGFSARIKDVNYSIPERLNAPLIAARGSAGTPELSLPSAAGISGFSGSFSIEEMPDSGSATAPETQGLTIPDAPKTGVAWTAPVAPIGQAINVRPAPEVHVEVGALPELPSVAGAPALKTQLPPLSAHQPLVVAPLDGGAIEAALDRLKGTRGAGAAIPDYVQRLPEIFTVAGTFLAQDMVIDAAAIIRNVEARAFEAGAAHDRLLMGMWAEFEQDDAVSQYNQRMAARVAGQMRTQNAAQCALWEYGTLGDAYQIGVAAHSMMMDIELSLHDVEFSDAMAQAEHAMQIAKAVVTAYRGAQALLQHEIESHGVAYINEEARAKRYRAQADAAQEQSRLNGAVADAFVASERAKQLQKDQFGAEVGLNEARQQAYKTRMRALSAQASTLGAEVDRYKTDVLQWEGGLTQVQAQYKQLRARARAVVAQNQNEATRIRLQGIQNDVVGVEAQRLAAQTQARAAKLRANAAARSAKYVGAEARNAQEGVMAQWQDMSYQGRLAGWRSTLDAGLAELDGVAAEQGAAARFFAATSDALHRADQITQSAQTAVAQAYENCREAAGRAGAAIEAGRMGGVSIRTSLGASAGYSASRAGSITDSVTYGEGVTESHSERMEEQ